MKAKQIIYALTVFTIMGIALYVASTFEYYGLYEECKMESNSQGVSRPVWNIKLRKVKNDLFE